MCCKTQTQWNEWSAWSGCSKKCGGGLKERTRTCDNSIPGKRLKSIPGRHLSKWSIFILSRISCSFMICGFLVDFDSSLNETLTSYIFQPNKTPNAQEKENSKAQWNKTKIATSNPVSWQMSSGTKTTGTTSALCRATRTSKPSTTFGWTSCNTINYTILLTHTKEVVKRQFLSSRQERRERWKMFTGHEINT